MKHTISKEEVTRLRTLAKRQAEPHAVRVNMQTMCDAFKLCFLN